jgi:phosphoribosylamine---glycine ligase
MRLLVVGGGGREHAMIWRLAQNPTVDRLFAAPGNAGIAREATCLPVAADDIGGIVRAVEREGIDLTVVGPEAPLVAGLADELEARGHPVFGPTRDAARIEGSKAWAKELCERHGIPAARSKTFTELGPALDFVEELAVGGPVVVKADGLAAGKGVVIAATRAEADAAVLDMLGGRFGSAGARVVIEEFMHGEEASLFAICDGKTAVLFGAAQDHKRVHDGDEGPNTGGMGTYSPPPVLTDALVDQAWRELIEPTVKGMAAEGNPYVGVLFAGLMLTPQGPKLVEYNARFGDPECQTLMLRLQSDLAPLLLAAAKGELAAAPAPVWREEAAICVVLAAEGYPDAPTTGGVISGAEDDFGGEAVIFHAGTARDDQGRLTAAGGRVLNICALGATLHEARDVAYAALGTIDLPGGFFRTDIGWRALRPRYSVAAESVSGFGARHALNV